MSKVNAPISLNALFASSVFNQAVVLVINSRMGLFISSNTCIPVSVNADVNWYQRPWIVFFFSSASSPTNPSDKKFFSTKYNEQRKLHKKTVVHHFCKSIRCLPFFHTVNVKPWNVEEVQNVYKLHCYDDVLNEYKARISRFKKEVSKNV